MVSAWNFVGQLHPLLVHLPIGILVLLAGLEVAGCVTPNLRLARGPRGFIVTAGAVTAIIAAVCGWVLSRNGEYDPELLERHRNLGFLTAGLAVALAVIHARGWMWAYGLVLTLTLGTLGVAGHLGGSLTHGEGFLTWATTSAGLEVPADINEVVVYRHLVQPIIELRCLSCHGSAKSNGGLRLDSWTAVLEGGNSGPALVAGDASKSLLLQRVHLPLDVKEHMPPKGRPQLTDDEVRLLEWWVEVGVSPELTLAESTVPDDVGDLLAVRFPSLRGPVVDLAVVRQTAAALEASQGVVIRRVAADHEGFTVNARLIGARFGDLELSELAPIALAIESLDLGETAVTDAGLMVIGAMKNLRRLHLDRTQVTDSGLTSLAGLSRLEFLNLHSTAVTDEGIEILTTLGRLRILHVWQTAVTRSATDQLGRRLADQRQLRRWREEIHVLQGLIREESFVAHHGDEGAGPSKILVPDSAYAP